MKHRNLTALLCLSLLGMTAWVNRKTASERAEPPGWTEVVPGVLRSPGLPTGYALVSGQRALLIDAPHGSDGLQASGITSVEAVLLTHHHRDTSAAVPQFLRRKVQVRAPKASADLLTPAGVAKYWQESLPLRNSRTAYLVPPEGLAGIDCSLTEGQVIDWQSWQIRVVETPGHSRDHVAYAVRRGLEGPLLLFCGDALAGPGKLWSPYTTDWDHWTDLGLKPTGESLRKLAGLKPDLLLPAHGPVIRKDVVTCLEQTAKAVEEVGFLKSFERYTKERLGQPPSYAFLAREQAMTNGSKPWSRISEHLFNTGNTFVLVSKEERACLVIDPWDPHSARQIPKLKADRQLGPLEVVLCSHAHFDHYDGIYSILEREKPSFWTLDLVATPLADPFLLRAPFLDPRPVKIDRRLRDGETASWREYRLRFVHLPGQSEFTMGVETVIDGKRCYFTADNFYHQDMFSGSGGWMGLNRSWPMSYAGSAQKVLEAAPDWVLAEHGGAMEFSAEDFKRRVQWGKEAARAADAISPSGNHLRDWNPHAIHVEPLVQKGRPGDTLRWTLVADNPLSRPQTLRVKLDGRGLVADQSWELQVAGGGSVRKEFSLRLARTLPPGRNIFIVNTATGDGLDPSDSFLGVDAE